MTDQPTYRLPDWLGGHEVFHVTPQDGPRVSVDMKTPDGIPTTLTVNRKWLVEVRPPSIDDPVAWPQVLTDPGLTVLEIRNSRLEGCAATVSIGQDGGVAEEVDLSVTQLRLLARAAWQRANAIEGGAPSTVDLPALPAGLEFPGEDVAERLPDGGWKARAGWHEWLDRLPKTDLPMRGCNETVWANNGHLDGRAYEWQCARHTREWHIRTVDGYVLAIWRNEARS